MARKIKIDNNLLDLQVNNKKSSILRTNVVVIVIIGILVALLICGYIYFYNKISDYTSEINELKAENSNVHSDLFCLIGTDSVYYVKEKLDFYNDNVVFQIKGYGNYYYTYDCMLKKTTGKSYNYWAYNIDAAKSMGLKKGSC